MSGLRGIGMLPWDRNVAVVYEEGDLVTGQIVHETTRESLDESMPTVQGVFKKSSRKRLKPQHITITNGNDQFYPTPDKLAGMMLAGIDWDKIETILEPSAGKGDLLMAATKASAINNRHRRRDIGLEADCIEIDPYLRRILEYNFSEESVQELRERYRELDKTTWSSTRTQAEKEEHKRLLYRIKAVDSVDMRIIHDDLLTYKGGKRYHLILMNPPFSEGDLHLLKALELQKYGGQIICLLNTQTILDPNSKRKRLLVQQLEKYKAKITFVENAFSKSSDAERTAEVDVAIIKVSIPFTRRESTIYERMKKAQEQDEGRCDNTRDSSTHNRNNECDEDNGENSGIGIKNNRRHEYTDLAPSDFAEYMVAQFNLEVSAGMELIHEYDALVPYMMTDLPGQTNSFRNEPILNLYVGRQTLYNGVESINRYLREVRYKYWRVLLNNDQVIGRLTSKLQDEYRNSVGKMSDYDFSIFNITQIMAEIKSQIVVGVKESIMTLFDTLTTAYSYYPECKNNIHYFNGWKTNKAHKIGKKSILPSYGIFSNWDARKDCINSYEASKQLSDIEKVFNYLDGRMLAPVSLGNVLNRAEMTGQTKNIECKYFKVDFYKKGTMHIKFTDQEIVDRMNIYVAQNRNWLPPYYGKMDYEDMCDEGKAVVDEFQGKAAYGKVMSNKEFYLAEVGMTVAIGELGINDITSSNLLVDGSKGSGSVAA